MFENCRAKEVLEYFEAISSIPRGSGNVAKISDYLVSFAKEHGISVRQDEALNVVMYKEATAGFEDRPAVILQGHMDIVAVKTEDCTKELDKEGLTLCVDGDYLYADKTSLGADDGVAVAMIMAIMASDKIAHHAIWGVITVDEEIGMLGAAAIELEDVAARLLINLDSEDEGVLTVGCAGGATVALSVAAGAEEVSLRAVRVSISELTGGHSGVEIIEQRANANVLLGRLLGAVNSVLEGDGVKLRIADISGGEKDNAIARMAEAKILVPASMAAGVLETIHSCAEDIRYEYSSTDSAMRIEAEDEGDYSGVSYDETASTRVCQLLRILPNGIIKMSNDIKGLVQTSLNMGVLRGYEDRIDMTFSVRSSVGTEKAELIDRISCIAAMLGATVSVSGEYPAWEYKKDSRLRELCRDIYKRMFDEDMKVETIHAGLECGLLSDKLTGLDCVSFGPSILDIHTTSERLSLASLDRTYDYLLTILKEV